MTASALVSALMLLAASVVTPIPASSPVTPAPSSLPSPAAPTPVVTTADLEELRARALVFPVPAVDPGGVPDTFGDPRYGGAHQALDIAAPHGSPVLAVDDGVVAKLFESVPGGHTMYLFDRDRRFAYYYAHLDGYVADLHETDVVRRGDQIGYVGSSGNAASDSPHLHFAIFKLDTPPRWWHGTPINPHPLFVPPRSYAQWPARMARR